MSDLFVLRVSRSPDQYTLSVASRPFRAQLQLKPRTVRWLLGGIAFLYALLRS